MSDPQVLELSVEEKMRMAQKFISDANPIPEIPDPPSDFVQLDGGFIFDKEPQYTAVVRELTGEHEEALSRSLKSGNTFHFLQVLLESGTASIGNIVDPVQVKKALRAMLIGDRDLLVLAIRIATYGKDLEVLQWACPSCGSLSDLTLDLEDLDIKNKKLENIEDATFEVELRKGARATVRLATGEDQLYVFDKADLTGAERDSRLLSKCVTSVIDANGRTHKTVVEPAYVLKLSIPDRHTILKALQEGQPGPQYNNISFKHEECGNEVTISLGLVDLFRDLIFFL
jgi:hypothetical protein